MLTYEEREELMQLKKEKRIDELFHEIGLSSHVKGYEYVKEAVFNISNDKYYYEGVIPMYIDIASNHNDTYSRVERAMRHCIEGGFRKISKELKQELFGNSLKSKPATSEFVYTIANKIRIETKIEMLNDLEKLNE